MEKGTCRLGEGECSKTGSIIQGWCGKHYNRMRNYGNPYQVRRIMGDDEARFWSKVDRRGDSDCWLWNDSTDGNGYGIFSSAGRIWRAHRWAYDHFVGAMPDGLPYLDHACHSRVPSCRGLCDHRRCVNFLQVAAEDLHLEPVTKRKNAERSHRTDFPHEVIMALYARWVAGEIASVLAAEVGMNLGALNARFYDLEKRGFGTDRPNRKPRRLTTELVMELHGRYMARESVSALAVEIGMDPTAIYYQFRQHGLEYRKAHSFEAAVARARKRLAVTDGPPEQLALF